MVQYRLCANHAVCGNKVAVSGRCKHCPSCRASGLTASPTNQYTAKGTETISVPEQVSTDRERIRTAGELTALRARYKESLGTIQTLEDKLHALDVLRRNVETFSIKPKHGHGTSEATAVAVASDWHIEETVGAEVGGLNRYTPEIADARATTFFQSLLRLVRLLQQDVTITTLILALLGDFITGNIHGEESAEKNDITPTHAIVRAQNLIISGIDFLLAHSTLNLVIPCASGNHARTTMKTRFSAENGHSLEYLMYLHLAAYYRGEKRVTFIIPEGIHSYVNVYDLTLRFHHGHAIKYGGGVGGITIPVNKAIAQWDQACQADIDVFGHFHQMTIHNKFVCNGSMIGYNGFAMAIKAAFERPQQALFLLDKKRGKTAHWPILFPH